MVRRTARWSLVLSLIALLSLLSIPAALAHSGSKEKAPPPAAGKFSVPVVVDGVRHAPKDMARFNGRTMHYVVDREAQQKGVLYAFTTIEGRQQYLKTHWEAPTAAKATSDVATDDCILARFNNVPYATYSPFLTMYCGQTNNYLSDDWNDRISYVEGGGSYTILYKGYNYTLSTLTVQGGVTIPDLNAYSFNNITSSIKVCVSQPPYC